MALEVEKYSTFLESWACTGQSAQCWRGLTGHFDSGSESRVCIEPLVQCPR